MLKAASDNIIVPALKPKLPGPLNSAETTTGSTGSNIKHAVAPKRTPKPKKAKKRPARKSKRRKKPQKARWSRRTKPAACPTGGIPEFHDSNDDAAQSLPASSLKPEPKDDDKGKRSAEAIADEETCRRLAYKKWSDEIIASQAEAMRENVESDWPLDPALQLELGKASEKIVQLAEQIAQEKGKALKAADIKRDRPQHIWKILRRAYLRHQRRLKDSNFQSWVHETINTYQPKFQEQENYRRQDDLDDEESRIEYDIWNALEKAVKKAAEDFKLEPGSIWDALLEGFRTHPKLAPIVDEIPGTVIDDRAAEFRVTKGPYAVWARFGGNAVFRWGRILKNALIPEKHSYDAEEEFPWHHFQMIKKQGSRTINKEIVIPGRLTVKGAASGRAIGLLRDRGVRVYMRQDQEKAYRAKIMRFLDWEPTCRIGKRKPHPGWWKMDDGRDFLLRPDRALMPSPAPASPDHAPEPIIEYELDSKTRDDAYGLLLKGNAAGWRKIAARHAKDSNVVMAVGIFLAAPVVRWSGEPPCIYNFFARHKKGKSAFFQIPQALVGKPYRPGSGDGAFGFSWDTTANKLLDRALLRNDFGMSLDEIGVGDPKAIARAAYTIAAGVDRGRRGQPERSFNVLAASNGEKPFSQLLSDAGLKVMGGQLVRVIDIPAEVQPGSVYESVPGIPAEIAKVCEQIYRDTLEHYGWAGLEWQQCLVNLQSGEIKTKVRQFKQRWCALDRVKKIITTIPPEYESVVGGFALISAALVMAGEAGITPSTWTREATDEAVAACLQRWADMLTKAEHQLLKKIVDGLRNGRYIHIHKVMAGSVTTFVPKPEDADDFAKWNGLITDGVRDGFVKIEKGGVQRRVLIARATFESLCGGRQQARELAQRFLERGWLDRDADHLTKNETIADGKTLRCYVLRAGFVVEARADQAEAKVA